MGGLLREKVLLDACSEELHNFLFSLSWDCAIRKDNIQVFPVVVHLAQNIGFQLGAEGIQELCAWRNRVTLEVFLIFHADELEKLLHLGHVSTSLESSLSRLVDLCSWYHSVN